MDKIKAMTDLLQKHKTVLQKFSYKYEISENTLKIKPNDLVPMSIIFALTPIIVYLFFMNAKSDGIIAMLIILGILDIIFFSIIIFGNRALIFDFQQNTLLKSWHGIRLKTYNLANIDTISCQKINYIQKDKKYLGSSSGGNIQYYSYKWSDKNPRLYYLILKNPPKSFIIANLQPWASNFQDHADAFTQDFLQILKS